MTMELAARENGSAIEAVRPTSGLALSFAEMTRRVAEVDQFYREVMQDGTDYGVIPGTQKPSLYQPGAQMLDQIFGLVPSFDVQASSVIDWHRPIPFFHYIVRCRLMSRRTGELVAEAIGSCNSHEDRYRWRQSKRTCPVCGAEAIIKGKSEYGGGWLCFKKNGGCGAKYHNGDAAIEGQQAGRVENEDTASLENTILKMAQKRAHVAATLNATGASRIFTQDIEDLPQFQQAVTQATVVQSSSAPARSDEEQPSDPAPAHDRPNPNNEPADEKNRATFERNWQAGTAKAVAVGVAPPDKPKNGATLGELKKATVELKEAIANREKLNRELLEKVALANEHDAGYAAPDPSKLTDAEVHDQIATCNRVLDAAEQADADDEAF